MPRKFYDKPDENQKAIVAALRKLGYSVEINHDDILVGHAWRTYWYEIKTLECVSKRTGKILESCKKDSQKMLEKTFQGHYRIVTTIDEILEDLRPSIY